MQRPTEPGVVLVRWNKVDPKTMTYVDIIKLILLFGDFVISELDHLTVSGGIVLIDMEGFTYSHLALINLSAMRNAMQYIQHVAPIRMKRLLILNANSLTQTAYDFTRPVVSKKIHERVSSMFCFAL